MTQRAKNRYLRKLIYWRPVRNIMHTSRLLVLPGFQGVPLFDVVVFFIKGLTKGALNQRAAATSFHFVLAIFPLILFIFTLLPYFDVSYYSAQLFSLLREYLPESIYPPIEATLSEILHRKHNGLLSLGFISSIYVASNGINAILVSFNQSHHSIEKRKWLKRRIVSIIVIIAIGIVLLVSFALIGGFKSFASYLQTEGILDTTTQYYLLKAAKWVLLIGVVYLFFATLYFYTPAERSHYRYFSAGATLGTVLFILTTQGFKFYIVHFSHYNALYGSIGALIVFLLWTYLNSFILLIGFELNASIAGAASKKISPSSDETVSLNRTSTTGSLLKRWQKWQARRRERKSISK